MARQNEDWLEVQKLQKSFTEDWGTPKSRSLTPQDNYEDIDHLKKMALEALRRSLGEAHCHKILEIQDSKDEVDFFARASTLNVNDADKEQLLAYRSKIRNTSRSKNIQNGTLIGISVHRRLRKKRALTKLGVLFFSPRPTLHYPGAYIQCVRYEGLDTTSPREQFEVEGGLVSQFLDAINFIQTKISSLDVLTESDGSSQKIYQYPIICLREVMPMRSAIEIMKKTPIIYTSRFFLIEVEVHSPGFWQGRSINLGEAKLLSELIVDSSDQRNARISGAFADVNIVEREGSGLRKAVAEAGRRGAREPVVRQDHSHVVVTVFPASEGIGAHRDFFISRAGINAEFAIWLGKLIKAQGKTYVLQDEHFGHQNFMGAMDRALKSGARVVGLLSQAYLESDHCLAEAAAALDGDPLNKQQRLILLRLEPCAPGGVLVNIAFTDLVAERRQVDARPLALKVLRALGFENPKLDGLPPPPEGTLSKSIQILHPEVQAVPGFTGREGELAGAGAGAVGEGRDGGADGHRGGSERGYPHP